MRATIVSRRRFWMQETWAAWLAWAAALALLAPVASIPAHAGAPQLNLERARLQVGIHQIDAQVAQTAEQRAIGLMHRRAMPPHEGMLFIFEQAGVQCFWMKNTLIALTVAFLSDDGRIVNLADMQALSEKSHCSEKPVRFVLEMNQGWFAQRGIEPGHKISARVFQRR